MIFIFICKNSHHSPFIRQPSTFSLKILSSICSSLSIGWAPVAHACNPSYSGSRDQEDQGSKPSWANRAQDPISKKKKKKIGGVAQSVGPKFKPQY
jgi:hypothetical protein